MVTQKELDLEVADRLDDFASNLSKNADIRGKMNDMEYYNIITALRYAVASLRTENRQ